MRISSKTIEKLVDIITGNTHKSPYRSGSQLIEFFMILGNETYTVQASQHAMNTYEKS